MSRPQVARPLDAPVPTPGATTAATAVIGLGNPLLRDDGLGLVLLERLRERGPWQPEVELVDGGTWGLSLLPVLADHARVLVLDAIRAGEPPGTVLRGSADDLPRLYAHPLSPHQIDLVEVLAAATMIGEVPDELLVVGVEPAATDGPHVGLTDPVEAAVPVALAEAERLLAGWGHRASADAATGAVRPVASAAQVGG